MLFFVPVYPIRSVRVLAQGSLEGFPFIYMRRSMRVAEVPLDKAHVRRVYAGVAMLIAFAAAFIWVCAALAPRS